MNNIITISLATLMLLVSTSCSRIRYNDLDYLSGGNGDGLEVTVRLLVASRHADCVTVDERKCLLVKEGEDDEWNCLYSPIGGFEYEEGNEYELAVKLSSVTNPPEDASSVIYTLLRVVSKRRMESENLPSWLP